MVFELAQDDVCVVVFHFLLFESFSGVAIPLLSPVIKIVSHSESLLNFRFERSESAVVLIALFEALVAEFAKFSLQARMTLLQLVKLLSEKLSFSKVFFKKASHGRFLVKQMPQLLHLLKAVHAGFKFLSRGHQLVGRL